MKYGVILFLFLSTICAPVHAMERPEPTEKRQEYEQINDLDADLLKAVREGDQWAALCALVAGADIFVLDDRARNLPEIARLNGHKKFSSWLAKRMLKIVRAQQEFANAANAFNLEGMQAALKDANFDYTGLNQHLISVAHNDATGAALAFLLDHGANPHFAEDDEGRQPIHVVQQFAQIEVIKIILEHGAYINTLDTQGNTPLDDALEAYKVYGISNAIGLRWMLLAGAVFASKDITQTVDIITQLLSPLSQGLFLSDDEAVICRLHELDQANTRGLLNEQEIDEINEALIAAAARDKREILRILIRTFAPLFTENSTGDALYATALHGYDQSAMLIADLLDIETTSVSGSMTSAVLVASAQGHAAYVQALLDFDIRLIPCENVMIAESFLELQSCSARLQNLLRLKELPKDRKNTYLLISDMLIGYGQLRINRAVIEHAALHTRETSQDTSTHLPTLTGLPRELRSCIFFHALQKPYQVARKDI